MKKLTRILTATLIAFLIAVSAHAADQADKQVNIISGPFGTGSYVLSTALEDISKKNHTWLKMSASETPGLVFNTKKLDRKPKLKKNTIMSYTVGINWLAKSGKKPFKKKYPSALLIANYNLGAVWLASIDKSINSRESLAGKRVAIGRGTQILWAIEPVWLINHGWHMKNDIKIQYVGTKPAVTALMDGLVDAAVVGGYADPVRGTVSPSPQTMELLASGKTLNHIPWGRKAVMDAHNQGMPIAPITLPAGSIKGLDKDLEVFVDLIGWCAYPEFSEELAYEVTKMIIQNVDKFSKYHNLGKLMSPKSLAYGWDQKNIHPGALRAYKEAGVLK